jgi:hypothetical protein
LNLLRDTSRVEQKVGLLLFLENHMD